MRGKGFAWEARERDGGGLAVRVEREEKELILESNPDVYFTSPHYTGFPAVQIDVDAVGRDELWEQLEDAWLIQAPKKLAAAYVAQRAGLRRSTVGSAPPCPTPGSASWTCTTRRSGMRTRRRWSCCTARAGPSTIR